MLLLIYYKAFFRLEKLLQINDKNIRINSQDYFNFLQNEFQMINY